MTLSYRQQLRSFGRDIKLFLLTAVLVAFAWDGMRTVLFNLYLLRLGYGPELVGAVNASNALVFALGCLLAGTARWSKRRPAHDPVLLMVGLGLMTLGMLLLPLSEFVPPAWRVGWLLAIGLPTYVGEAMYLVYGLPFMMAVTRPAQRNVVFSLHMALLPVAGFAGSLTAGFLPQVFGQWLGISLQEAAAFRYPLLLESLFMIPPFLVLSRTSSRPAAQKPRPEPARAGAGPRPDALLPEQEGEGEAQQAEAGAGRLPLGLLLMMALVMALRFGGRGAVQTFFNVYLDDGLGTSTVLIGTILAVAQLASVPAALAAPSLVARRGPVPIIARGMVGAALATLPLALVPHWTAAALGYVASTALFATTAGPTRLFSQELVAPAWRTAMATAYMIGPGLAYAFMALAGGYAITILGYDTVFLAAALVTAAGALLFWVFFRVPRGELAHPDASAGPEQVCP